MSVTGGALTWRDGLATAATGGLVAAYVGLVQEAAWAPITSVRGYAALFLLVGQVTCAVCAAELARSGLVAGPGYFVGPLALVATVLALVTGSAGVMGVGVVALVLLWALGTALHARPHDHDHDHHRHHGGPA